MASRKQGEILRAQTLPLLPSPPPASDTLSSSKATPSKPPCTAPPTPDHVFIHHRCCCHDLRDTPSWPSSSGSSICKLSRVHFHCLPAPNISAALPSKIFSSNSARSLLISLKLTGRGSPELVLKLAASVSVCSCTSSCIPWGNLAQLHSQPGEQ